MLSRFSLRYAILSCILDFVATLSAFSFAIYLRPRLPQLPFLVPLSFLELPVWTYVAVPIAWVSVFLVASVYDTKKTYKVVDELQATVLGSVLAALLCAGIFFLAFKEFSRYVFVIFVVLNVLLLVGWRLIARIILRVGRIRATEKRVVIVGLGDVGRRVGRMMQPYSWTGLTLVGYLDDADPSEDLPAPVIGRLADTRRVITEQQIDDVVFALPQDAYGHMNPLIVELQDLGVNMRVVPDYYNLLLYKASVDDLGGLPMISLRDPTLNEFQRLVKRLLDLAVAGIVTTLLLPIMGLIAILIKLDSPGPVIFRQKRYGENGRLFDMFKFRSMVVGADKRRDEVSRTDDDGNLVYKQKDDPRVTRVGRILRRTSLDEIPQLFNVIRGDMSLVGPRPELPWLVSEYEPWQHRRFSVPQGITGWWQVNGRADKPLHLHTEDDLYYIQNYSLWMDLYILIKTPLVVMRGRGAY